MPYNSTLPVDGAPNWGATLRTRWASLLTFINGVEELAQEALDTANENTGGGGGPAGATTGTVNVRDFGAVGDGITDDAPAFRSAIASVPAGRGVALVVPAGYSYRLNGEIAIGNRPGSSITGGGRGSTNLIMTHGFRLSVGGFSASKMTMVAAAYSSSARAFGFITPAGNGLTANVAGFTFSEINFSGFFYSTDMRGADYDVASTPGWSQGGALQRIRIIDCTSRAPATSVGVAGHFQHISTYDVTIMGCSTYGGSGATSYNFIGRNEQVRIVGCYDENNTYGSVEIENGCKNVTISGSTFNSIVWIDDSAQVTVSGNTIRSQLLITAQTFGTNDVNVTGNIIDRIRLAPFSSNPNHALGINRIVITANNITSPGASHGILIEAGGGMVRIVDIRGNMMSGSFSTSSVAVVRGSNCHVTIIGNTGAGGNETQIVTSGSGGIIYAWANSNMPVNGSVQAFTP